MILFWTIAALMILGLLGLLLYPLLRGPCSEFDTRSADAASIDVYREQLADLDAQLANEGGATPTLVEARTDVERALLASVGDPTRLEAVQPSAQSQRSARRASVALAATLAIGLPAVSYVLYLAHGEPRALDPTALAPRSVADRSKEPNAADIGAMVARLEQRLQSEPQDGPGWRMLGRSYFVLQRYPDAVLAFAKASTLLGESADLLVETAEAQAFAVGNRLGGEPRAQLERALELEPNHPKGLWLGGFAALQDGQPELALRRWNALLSELPPQSKEASTLNALIEGIARAGAPTESQGPGGTPETTNIAQSEGRSRGADASGAGSSGAGSSGAGSSGAGSSGAGSSGAGSSGAGSSGTSPQGPRVRIEVSVAPSLIEQVPAAADLFVIARDPDGPPMPLAVVKRSAGSLPLNVSLSDANAMTPQARLSGAKRVVLTARIALSGGPIAASGDLEGSVGPLPLSELLATDPAVSIVIERVVP